MAQTFSLTLTPSIQRTFLILLNVVFWCYPANGRILHDIHYNTALNNTSLKTCQHIYGNLTLQELARFADASGKPSSGIYGGNTLWYGSYSECQQLPDSRYCLTMFPGISGIDRVTPFTKFLQVKCAEDPEYTATVVITIIFCGLLVGICLLATIMEILKASNNPDNKVEVVENSGHISMDKDANEKTLLLPDATTKVTKDEGKRGTNACIQKTGIINNLKMQCSVPVEFRKYSLF
ncbi:Hypothetical predicted protein [Paramuricea clavata]|uniref:Nose resistant-to-fluoxetine protein N-terminal domain-containing protein n=1 Tax=Paramuricea clavata TaxID=317549 RepID=A0A7D9J9N9_PARCT|nr:Hypothetical predicted protein [Paramuricea clavata]